jgi:pimeloyl-ACP methyl ester carboxylesterase
MKMLLFMGMGACVEPFELQRLTVLAALWRAHVTTVDTPGCGYGNTRLSPRERKALIAGDFTAVAGRMVTAAQTRNPLLRRPITIVGYSLGASIAAAAASVPGLLRVQQFIAVEPAAMRPRNPVSLLRAAQAEETALDSYLKKNCGAIAPAARRGESIPQSRIDLALLGYALSRGRLARDLRQATNIQSFPVQIVHGTHSRLAPANDVRKVITACRLAGIDARDVPVAGGHAMWHSLPDVAGVANVTRRQWT